jgi:hypothetical protein
MHSEHQVPIWFFIGAILLIYGVLIVGAGVYGLTTPTDVQRQLQQSWPDAPWYYLHPGVWWGAVMIALGLFYCLRFNPFRAGETLTGRAGDDAPPSAEGHGEAAGHH